MNSEEDDSRKGAKDAKGNALSAWRIGQSVRSY